MVRADRAVAAVVAIRGKQFGKQRPRREYRMRSDAGYCPSARGDEVWRQLLVVRGAALSPLRESEDDVSMPSKKSKQKLKNISERGYSTVSAPRKRQEEVEDLKAQKRLVRAVLSARQGGVSLRVAPSRVDGASSATARLSAGDSAACAPAAPESEVHAESEVHVESAESGPATERLEGDDLFKLDDEVAQTAPSRAAPSAGRGSSIPAPASYAAAISPVLTATPSDILPSPLGVHSPRSGPAPVPERQRSDRAWNPEDAARSIPLQRFPAFQAPQDELPAPSASLSSAGGASSAATAEEDEVVAVAAADEEAAADEAVAVVAADEEAVADEAVADEVADEAAAATAAAAAAAAVAAEESASDDGSEEGVMCAICHGNIQPLQAAMVRGCEHPFCAGCILNWALQKVRRSLCQTSARPPHLLPPTLTCCYTPLQARCPLCNIAFTHVWAYREMDGTYNDYLVESAVAVLHCAQWFKREVESRPGGGSAAHAQPGDADDADEYHEMLQYRFGGSAEEEYDEDYYYGLQDRLQGSARAVGNRRWGEGGFVQGGRKAAKAKAMTPPSAKGKGAASGKGVAPLCAQPCGSYADPAGVGREGTPNGKGVAREPSEEWGGGGASGGARGPGKKAHEKAEKAALKERQREERREMALSKKEGKRTASA